MFDHNDKRHTQGPKHANVPMSIRAPVRKQHEHDPKWEKAQLKKDEPKKEPAAKPKQAVKPFPGEKTEK